MNWVMIFALIKTEMKVIHRLAYLILLTGAIFTGASAQRNIEPQGGRWVHDEAGVLSADTEAQLEQFLRNEEDSTSNQIGVYIIKSLDGEDIDQFAYRVATAWKIGTAAKDNGVLMLIALDERMMSIQVGKGLEGVLTDVTAARIRRNEINPHFQQGDYETGVKAGVVAIVRVIHGEYTNDDPPLRAKRKKGSPWITLIIIILFVILGSRRGGRGGGGGISRGAWMLPMMLGGMGRSSGGSWGGGGGGGSWGGGGSFGGGGSSGSW
jgi:uncharacterized protein